MFSYSSRPRQYREYKETVQCSAIVVDLDNKETVQCSAMIVDLDNKETVQCSAMVVDPNNKVNTKRLFTVQLYKQ